MIRVAAALIALLPATGSAIGLCEDPSTTISQVAYSPKTHQLLVEGAAEWCRETDEAEEERGAHRFAEVLDAKNGKVVARYGEADGEKPLAELAALRAKVEFAPVKKWTQSPSGTCTVVADQIRAAGACAYVARVVARKKTLTELKLAECATEAEDGRALAEALWLPKGKKAVVVAEIERCIGGPPPGYFGPDDPGECYVEKQRVVRTLGGAALSACFMAPDEPAVPGEPTKSE